TFGTAVDYSVGGWNRYVAAADFDNDGHIDLATANHSTDDISVLLNNGFGAFPERSDYNTGNHPHGIVAADLNGDAAVDLAVANWSSNNITVLLNDSTGTFTNAGNYDVGTRPTSVVGGDVDGDGDIDLVATNSGSDNMSILLNSGDGAFVTADPQYTGNTPYGICMADLDSDGDLDIVTANYVAHTISILINQNQPDMQFGNNPTTVSQGAPCSLRVEVEGYPQEALLFYRQGGDEVWQTAAMLQTEFTCCGVIPEEDVALRGLEYYFEVTKDGITGTLPESDPELYPFILKTSLTDQPGPILPGGAYRMIGFPFDVSPATARGVFEDDLGEPDASVWRLGRWNGSTGDYDEYWEVGDIHRGYGYWLVVRDQELSVDASGLSAVPDTSVGDLRFGEIVLSPGWNQISTPFAFPVSWFNRRVDLPIDPWPWEYISGTGAQTTYDTVSILEPFCGYWINNPTDSPRLLLIPYQRAGFGSVGREVSDNASEDGWELILSLNSAGLADRTNVAGVRAGALDGADEYDFCEPPLPPGEYISLAFLGNTEKGKERLLAGDYRPVESDGWIFDILVRGNTGETASIALSEPAQMPSGILTVFEDPSSGDSYQILPGVSLTIPHVLSQEGQAYRLIVGSQEYVDGLELNPLMMPAEFALEQNCPNPFNPLTAMDYSVPVPCHVKISIYNLLGQKIKTVVDEDKPAGSHTAFWDGTDSNGAEAATGVYFYQIEAGDFIKSRKMLLLK
ncbi:MAG: VCBS repeat-containing protein, partial [Candidatus Zixiibacteriota bacterium]